MGDSARAVLDRAMSEAAWQRQVTECAEANGWLLFHDNDARRNNPGYPDLTIVHPVRGRVCFAELKTMRGRLSHAQRVWRDALLVAGCDWRLWRPSDWDEVERTLKGTER